MTLNDSAFSQSITSVLCEMMAPLLQETIKSSIEAAIKILKLTILQSILDTNIKLHESVKKQNITTNNIYCTDVFLNKE